MEPEIKDPNEFMADAAGADDPRDPRALITITAQFADGSTSSREVVGLDNLEAVAVQFALDYAERETENEI